MLDPAAPDSDLTYLDLTYLDLTYLDLTYIHRVSMDRIWCILRLVRTLERVWYEPKPR